MNPHHPRFFLREDDDADAPHRAGAAGRAASCDNASAPPGGTGAWPHHRTPVRNTAAPGNTDDKYGRKRRNHRNAGKPTGRWPQPPVWRATGGHGKKTWGAAPGAVGICGTRFEGPKFLLRTFYCFYPTDSKMATAAGNTSGRGSNPSAKQHRDARERGKNRRSED